MIKLLIGGSPCTYWSIAQTRNRETTASGAGWELFKNFLIAKEKFKPDFFLYENNVSASPLIKAQIKTELNVYDGTFFMTDTGVRYIEINSALVSAQNRERFYVHNCGNVKQPADRGIFIFDILDSCGTPINTLKSNKARCVTSGYCHKTAAHILESNYSENPNKQKWDCVAVPINITSDGKARTIKAQYNNTGIANLISNGGFLASGVAIKTSERATDDPNLTGKDSLSIKRVYSVKNKKITIKGRRYDIELPDGNYKFRKLSVSECCRLQTIPDDYCRVLSESRAYKCVGNAWTKDVIIHILQSALNNIDKNEEIIVLSMYDGIGTGRLCLSEMGFNKVRYHAYEIDKYAIKVAQSNFPDIIQCGDAFAVRDSSWKLKGVAL